MTSSEDRRNGVKLEITKNGIKILNSNGKIQNIENQNVNFRQGLQVWFLYVFLRHFVRENSKEKFQICVVAHSQNEIYSFFYTTMNDNAQEGIRHGLAQGFIDKSVHLAQ